MLISETLSHYKILAKLGEGGMGVVYKAEDTKLKREVALKFLPSNALQGKDEKDRFTREAPAPAALNHPNIAHIYAIEEVEGQTFLALEFIEGLDLVGAISQSPLPFDRAIDYAPKSPPACKPPTKRASSTATSNLQRSWSPTRA